MITGEIKNKVDRLWDTFWEKSNIRTPVEVVSHLSYLFFMKMLDDAQTKEEATITQTEPFQHFDWIGVFGDKASIVVSYISDLHNVIVA